MLDPNTDVSTHSCNAPMPQPTITGSPAVSASGLCVNMPALLKRHTYDRFLSSPYLSVRPDVTLAGDSYSDASSSRLRHSPVPLVEYIKIARITVDSGDMVAAQMSNVQRREDIFKRTARSAHARTASYKTPLRALIPQNEHPPHVTSMDSSICTSLLYWTSVSASSRTFSW